MATTVEKIRVIKLKLPPSEKSFARSRDRTQYDEADFWKWSSNGFLKSPVFIVWLLAVSYVTFTEIYNYATCEGSYKESVVQSALEFSAAHNTFSPFHELIRQSSLQLGWVSEEGLAKVEYRVHGEARDSNSRFIFDDDYANEE